MQLVVRLTLCFGGTVGRKAVHRPDKTLAAGFIGRSCAWSVPFEQYIELKMRSLLLVKVEHVRNGNEGSAAVMWGRIWIHNLIGWFLRWS